MQGSFMKLVHLTIQGELLPEDAVMDVEDIFAEEGIGNKLYKNVRNAYCKVCTRLGAEDGDPDLDEIIRNMEALEREISFRMYQYGAKFGIR